MTSNAAALLDLYNTGKLNPALARLVRRSIEKGTLVAPAPIPASTGLSAGAQKVLADLRANAEGCSSMDSDGNEWRDVYLPNAGSGRSFAGYVSALTDAGFYKTQDGKFFGTVRL
ncbi:MAG: hypothetical protein EBT79_13310 [Actinobacteria bacterium]|nr:hypothetical protein [Actinomycetota bacterium]NBR68225.1 hypothetical protein [Actinomycetota bacterium]